MVVTKENVGDTVQESFQTHDPYSIADWPRIQSCEHHFENSLDKS